jgi:dephospho-CoA kinase
MIIGLTGGYCAGKNTVAAILESIGWTCIDVDQLGHEAISISKDTIIERFGSGVLGSDGTIDRRAVARIIFADPRALADQEAIIHPVAIRLLDECISRAEAIAHKEGNEARICINAALLQKSERIPSCEAIIEVRAPLACRIVRGMRRDSASARSVAQRIMRQRGFRAELYRAAHAAGKSIFVLRNSDGEITLKKALERTLARVMSTLPKATGSLVISVQKE